MTDIEGELRNTLHADAEQVPVPGDLAVRAVRRAGRIRRNRRIASAAGVAVAVLVTVLTVPLLRSHPQPPPDKAATVGTDPGAVHFDFDDALGSKSRAVNNDGLQMVLVYRYSTRAPLAYIFGAGTAAKAEEFGGGNTWNLFEGDTPGEPQPVTVAGRPGTIQSLARRGTDRLNWRIRWEARPGLFLRLDAQVATSEEALKLAAGVRPDQTLPCARPFRVSQVPDGFRRTNCEASLHSRAKPKQIYLSGVETWRSDRTGKSFDVWSEGTVAPPPAKAPPASEAKLGMRWEDKSRGPRLIVHDQRGMDISIQGLDEAEARVVGAGISVPEDLSRPETWPR